MTLDEVKEKFHSILGGATPVKVDVSPREGQSDFSLSLSINEVGPLDTALLLALLDLSRDSAMELIVNPESTDSVLVELRKEPVTLGF